ncbi:MAG: hypothetical protein ABSB23_16320 [Bryobacteraceae bacterium]
MAAIVPAVAVKLAEVAPDATATDAGTVNAVTLLDSVTVMPPAPAGCDSVTEHAEVPPELRLAGVHDTKLIVDGATSSMETVCVLPLYVAVTTAVWLVAMVPAVAVKLAVLKPLATVTDPGTVSVAALLVSVTETPPAPAAFDSVTVQVDVAPELRFMGAQASDVKAGGVDTSVRDCVWELPFKDAVMTAVWLVEIVPAVAVKFAELAPDTTLTEPGTVNAVTLLDSVTVIPPVPAACESVTVQVDVPPELRLVGLHDTKLTVVGATNEIDAVCELPL